MCFGSNRSTSQQSSDVSGDEFALTAPLAPTKLCFE